MPTITYIEHDGTEHAMDVPVGNSVMQGAFDNNVPGIDADCGGECACATCHVHIDPAWRDKLPPMSDMENSMLDLTDERDERSRLGCQIKLGPGLSGIVVQTPLGQH